MHGKIILKVILAFCLLAAENGARADERVLEFRDYFQVEDTMYKLADLGKSEEALKILDRVLEEFPDDYYQTTDWMAYFYEVMGQYEKCLDIWEEGHKKGYYYGIYPSDARYRPFYKSLRFIQIAEEDERLMNLGNEKSESKIEVVTPEGYSPDKKYPLLIALHGGWGTIWHAKNRWKSDILNKDYILAFIQSYLHYDYNSYGWYGSDPRARKDIRKLFSEIVKEYSIDTTRVIIGGISAGGVMAVDVAVNNIIPTAGYIGVCPGMPPEFDMKRVTVAKERGLRVYMIAGETDYLRPEQDDMVKIFKEAGLPFQYYVIKDLGHAFPDDFPDWIDKALDFIFNQ